jgi:glycosyltransferase involved in cell wall biosynthesis/cytochrome c-type biogenesis protein CcmH/NrfG
MEHEAVTASTRISDRPFASVIVPTYRSERFLGECLASVRDQSFSDFECIVVDDASPEADSSIAAQFAADDHRFRCIRHPSNRGVSAARNTGIGAARGEFVLFLDSDDVLLPDALASQRMLACRHNVDAVWTTGEFWHGLKRTHRYYHGEIVYFSSSPMRTEGSNAQREASLRPFRFSAPNGCLLLRREVLSRSAILFDDELVRGEDVEFAARALRACASAAVAPLVTFLYRRGHDSASYVQSHSAEHWRSFGRFFRKISDRNEDWQDFRLFVALRHLGSVARHIATFRQQLPHEVAREVVGDIAVAYRGIDPVIFDRTASHPGDVPSEWEPCFRPLFAALIGQDAAAVLTCIDALSRTMLRNELVEASRLRAGGYYESADKLIIAAYEQEPSHPEFALEYGRILLREKDKRAAALDLFGYAYAHSVRLFEPTGALSWALAGAKKLQDAIDVIKQSLSGAPHSPALFDLLAKLHRRAGDSGNRLIALRQACLHAPKDPFRRERLIEALLECANGDDAREEIDRFAPWMGEQWRERMLAIVERETASVSVARERIDRLVQQTTESDLLAVRLQGDLLVELEDHAAALRPLEIAAYHEQNSAAQRIKLATAAYKAGHWERAFDVLREVADYPDPGIDHLFAVLLDKVSAADAIAFLAARETYVAGAPSALAKLWKAARVAPHAGELAASIRELLQLGVDRNPQSPLWRLTQLEFLLSQKATEAALEVAEFLCGTFPSDPRGHMALGRCLAADKRFAEAAEAGRAACRLAPNNGEFARAVARWTVLSKDGVPQLTAAS